MQSDSSGGRQAASSPPGGSIGVGDLVDGKYRLIRVIGEGGWGIVFEGENLRTMRRVAIKILRAQANVTPDVQARFEREAQAAGRIGSEHIVEVFDLGSLPDGTSYMVMELLSGQDLASRLEAGRLVGPAEEHVFLQVIEGLAAAHEAGILHRDLKPENLFLVPTRTGGEFVKILDFGISKFNTNVPGAVSATMTGAVLGSPVYMAPEQARGLKQIDARADLYSVGALFYECVTGRVPFEGDNFNDLMFKIVLAPRPNPLEFRADLDPGLVPILLKAIAVDPGARYQSAGEFRAAVSDWLASVGMDSAVPTEIRRGGRATPRSPGLTPTGGKDEAHWSAATVAVPSGSGTPLAAATPIDGAGSSGRKTFVFATLAAAVVLLAAGGVVLTRHRAGAQSSAAAQQAGMSQSQSSAVGAPGAAATLAPVAPDPQPRPQSGPVAVDSDATGAAATPSAAGRWLAGRGRWAPPVKAGRDAGSQASEPPKVVDATPAPPPPAAPPTPAAPVSTVEGREIRTGL